MCPRDGSHLDSGGNLNSQKWTWACGLPAPSTCSWVLRHAGLCSQGLPSLLFLPPPHLSWGVWLWCSSFQRDVRDPEGGVKNQAVRVP